MLSRSSLYVLLFLLCLSFVRCNQPTVIAGYIPDDGNFPKVANISTCKATRFVPAITNAINDTCNTIYTPTFLLAWDELKTNIGNPLKLDKADTMLMQVNEVKAFKDALSKGEYHTTVTVKGNIIDIIASFAKSLPFTDIMDTLTTPFSFKGVSVRGFGMPHYDEKIAGSISILYYYNDDNFIIKVTPKDDRQEIILAKGIANSGNLNDMLTEIEQLKKTGEEQKREKQFDNKYHLFYDDDLIIPVLKFNLEKSYENFLNIKIHAPHGMYSIAKAKQRTAFILDENGTKVESVAEVAVAAAAAPGTEEVKEVRLPKHLWFNKPFVVVLHKKDQPQPYFMAHIANPEVMIKK